LKATVQHTVLNTIQYFVSILKEITQAKPKPEHDTKSDWFLFSESCH